MAGPFLKDMLPRRAHSASCHPLQWNCGDVITSHRSYLRGRCLSGAALPTCSSDPTNRGARQAGGWAEPRIGASDLATQSCHQPARSSLGCGLHSEAPFLGKKREHHSLLSWPLECPLFPLETLPPVRQYGFIISL